MGAPLHLLFSKNAFTVSQRCILTDLQSSRQQKGRQLAAS
jgi:hypothetical protein